MKEHLFTGSVSLLDWCLKAKGELGYSFWFLAADQWNFMTNDNLIDVFNIAYRVARNSIREKSVKVDTEISCFVHCCMRAWKNMTCILGQLAFPLPLNPLRGFNGSIKKASL